VRTAGKADSILDINRDIILLNLFCSSFSVTSILSMILVVSVLFKERAIVFARSKVATLDAFNVSITPFL
jgi:hypothetical protein